MCIIQLTINCIFLIPQVCFTTKGVRIAGILKDKDEKFELNIHKQEVIKVIAHFGNVEPAQPLVTLYLLKTCAEYVKNQLKLPDDQHHEREFTSIYKHLILN